MGLVLRKLELSTDQLANLHGQGQQRITPSLPHTAMHFDNKCIVTQLQTHKCNVPSKFNVTLREILA